MGKFISIINKINKSYNQGISNFQDAQDQKDRDDALEKSVNKNNATVYSIKKSNDFSTEWTTLTTYDDDEQYIYWVITFEKFDIRLVPFLNISMFYRLTGGNTTDGTNNTSYLVPQNYNFIVEDISGESDQNYKKVKLMATMRFYNTEEIYDGKLRVTFVNPREYN